jgi:hypothetical protein
VNVTSKSLLDEFADILYVAVSVLKASTEALYTSVLITHFSVIYDVNKSTM